MANLRSRWTQVARGNNIDGNAMNGFVLNDLGRIDRKKQFN